MTEARKAAQSRAQMKYFATEKGKAAQARAEKNRSATTRKTKTMRLPDGTWVVRGEVSVESTAVG
jgi:hypothetical protein